MPAPRQRAEEQQVRLAAPSRAPSPRRPAPASSLFCDSAARIRDSGSLPVVCAGDLRLLLPPPPRPRRPPSRRWGAAPARSAARRGTSFTSSGVLPSATPSTNTARPAGWTRPAACPSGRVCTALRASAHDAREERRGLRQRQLARRAPGRARWLRLFWPSSSRPVLYCTAASSAYASMQLADVGDAGGSRAGSRASALLERLLGERGTCASCGGPCASSTRCARGLSASANGSDAAACLRVHQLSPPAFLSSVESMPAAFAPARWGTSPVSAAKGTTATRAGRPPARARRADGGARQGGQKGRVHRGGHTTSRSARRRTRTCTSGPGRPVRTSGCSPGGTTRRRRERTIEAQTHSALLHSRMNSSKARGCSSLEDDTAQTELLARSSSSRVRRCSPHRTPEEVDRGGRPPDVVLLDLHGVAPAVSERLGQLRLPPGAAGGQRGPQAARTTRGRSGADGFLAKPYELGRTPEGGRGGRRAQARPDAGLGPARWQRAGVQAEAISARVPRMACASSTARTSTSPRTTSPSPFRKLGWRRSIALARAARRRPREEYAAARERISADRPRRGAPRRGPPHRLRRPHRLRARGGVRAAPARRWGRWPRTRAAAPSSPATTTSTRPGACAHGRFERHFGHLLQSDLPEHRREGAVPVRAAGGETTPRWWACSRRGCRPARGCPTATIGEAQLEGLRGHRSRTRGSTDRAVLVVVHHAPLTASGQPDRPHHGLRRRGRAVLRLLPGPRFAVLHGHIHQRYHHPATDAAAPHLRRRLLHRRRATRATGSSTCEDGQVVGGTDARAGRHGSTAEPRPEAPR